MNAHLVPLIGGYTVVLKSEGIVKKYQADVLGVYRMVDSYNDRPVYKQDGGENFIFFSPGGAAGSCWLVGTVVGSQYGWLRNRSEEAELVRWPALLRTGWEFRDGYCGDWRTDDNTLRLQALPGNGVSHLSLM